MLDNAWLRDAQRLAGWEDRLASVIEQAREQPYKLGEHDCFRLSCRVIEALTGRDLWPQFAGSYGGSKWQALRRIAEFGGDFTAAASKLFGCLPRAMPAARRGDLCEFVDMDGEQHLGVLIGTHVAVLGPEGLAFAPREICSHCWRIG
jgi:hypothetical protein